MIGNVTEAGIDPGLSLGSELKEKQQLWELLDVSFSEVMSARS
jgi:hypothetical protein